MNTSFFNLLRFLPLLLLVSSLFGAPAPAGKAESKPAPGPTVLVLIDIQNFYYPGGKLPLVDPAAASLEARKLLDHFRTQGWPVVHVQHLPKGQSAPTPDSGDEQYRMHSHVMPVAGERVIGKHQANSFRDTELLATLRKLGARRLVICGMQTHMCVEAATRAAADLGFEVIVAHDACATRDLKFGTTEVPAAQVHAAALAAMQGGYARVLSVAELLSELKSSPQ